MARTKQSIRKAGAAKPSPANLPGVAKKTKEVRFSDEELLARTIHLQEENARLVKSVIEVDRELQDSLIREQKLKDRLAAEMDFRQGFSARLKLVEDSAQEQGPPDCAAVAPHFPMDAVPPPPATPPKVPVEQEAPGAPSCERTYSTWQEM